MTVKIAAVALFAALMVVTAVGWLGAGGGVDAAAAMKPVKRINLKYEFVAGFRPREITVVKGTKIVFTNQDRLDEIHHTVTKRATGGGVGDFFDSEDIAPGEQFARTFHAVGVVRYVCSYHDHMRGTITVVEAP